MDQNQKMARHIFAEPCIGLKERTHADNCAHHALRGEHIAHTADRKGREPNYAGWGRLYVQAGRPIPARFREAFEAYDNQAYARALRDDIERYGVSYAD